jgi:hypothetical protein
MDLPPEGSHPARATRWETPHETDLADRDPHDTMPGFGLFLSCNRSVA